MRGNKQGLAGPDNPKKRIVEPKDALRKERGKAKQDRDNIHKSSSDRELLLRH